MTFESRARGAVLDIHRAVEVMEMAMSTDQKQPGTVERFDRFRDRKQRNRRIGAILVAGALVVAAIVVVSTNMLGKDEVVPASAPQGRLLYEVYAGGDTSALYSIDAAGGPSIDLGVDTDPTSQWSPDGTRILVTSTAGPEATALPVRPATIASDGSDFRLLDGVEDRSLNLNCTAFSPDGSRLVCEGYSDLDRGVYTVRSSDGGGLRALTDFIGFPGDFSPDGDQIVFVGDDSGVGSSLGDVDTLYVVGTDGADLREVTPPSSVLAFTFRIVVAGRRLDRLHRSGRRPDAGASRRHRAPPDRARRLDRRCFGWGDVVAGRGVDRVRRSQGRGGRSRCLPRAARRDRPPTGHRHAGRRGVHLGLDLR